MLPPGRAKLVTKPLAIGSGTFANTIGIVPVARCSGSDADAGRGLVKTDDRAPTFEDAKVQFAACW